MMSSNSTGAGDDLLWSHLKTLPAFRALLRAVEARFYGMIDLAGPVLDLGCGDGNFTELAFNRFGRRLDVGVDPWWNPLVKAVRGEVYPAAVQALGSRLPFADGYFGGAISNSVLEHIPDIQPVLDEMGRVIRPGGRFIMTMPNHRFTACLGGAQMAEKWGMPGLAGRYRRAFNTISRHAHTEPAGWWAERLAAAGFAVERWQYYFSPRALHVLEIGHAQGLPSAVLHALTGQWILAPTEENLAPVDRWVRPYFLEQADEYGTYQLIVARRADRQPIAVYLPPARPFAVDSAGRLVPDEAPPVEAPVPEPPPPAPTAADRAEAVEQSAQPAAPAAPWQMPAVVPFLQRNRLRLGLFLFAFILSYAAYGAAAPPGPQRPGLALALWITGGGLALAAAWWSRPLPVPRLLQADRRLLAAGLLLFAGALTLRLVDLTTHPFVLSGTEAQFGVIARQILSGLERHPFGTTVHANPTLPFYGLAALLRLFGQTTLALRLASPLAGALTVLVVFYFGRRLWSPEAGLAAAILLAGNHTHLHFSRLGLTNIWDPLLALLAIGCWLIAWRERRRGWWLAAGLAWGLSLYFFTAGHLLPLILLPLIGLRLVADRSGRRTNWRGLILAAALALVIALPLARHYLAFPDIFWERSNQYGIYPTNWLVDEAARSGRSPNALLVSQVWQSATAFLGTADNSLYYNSGRGLLGAATGVLFLGGLIVALRHGRRPENQALLLWILVAVIFAGSLLLQPPASHRLLIALPAAALLGGIGLAAGMQFLRAKLLPPGDQDRLTRGAHLILIGALALLLVSPETAFYFGEYRTETRFADPNTEAANQIGHRLQGLPQETVVYLYAAPRFFADFPNIAYLAPQFRPQVNLFDVEAAGLPETLEPHGRLIFIALPERAEALDLIEQALPGGQRLAEPGRYANPLFEIYDVTRP